MQKPILKKQRYKIHNYWAYVFVFKNSVCALFSRLWHDRVNPINRFIWIIEYSESDTIRMFAGERALWVRRDTAISAFIHSGQGFFFYLMFHPFYLLLHLSNKDPSFSIWRCFTPLPSAWIISLQSSINRLTLDLFTASVPLDPTERSLRECVMQLDHQHLFLVTLERSNSHTHALPLSRTTEHTHTQIQTNHSGWN